MFDRFTDEARKLMGLARREALRLKHDYIGTEHMLLGLTRIEGSAAGDVLAALDVGASAIRREVEALAEPGDQEAGGELRRLPFTPRAKRVLERTLVESADLGHAHVGTEHLLLALVLEEEGIAGLALARLGLRKDFVRREIIELVGGEVTREAARFKLTEQITALRKETDLLRRRVEALEKRLDGLS